MPSIDFYYMPESPPCRSVEMVAKIAGVTLNKHYINLFTRDHLKDEYLKVNPAHKVPFIVDGDLKLSESRAIMAYIVNKYMPENNSLYPKDPVKRAKVDELLFMDIGVFYAAGSKLLRPKLWGPVKELNADDEKAYRDVLEIFDKQLEKNGTKFYCGDEVTIGDISVAATFTFPVACGYDLSAFKSLTAYLDRLKSSIPNYHEINDKALETMTNFIKSKQEAK